MSSGSRDINFNVLLYQPEIPQNTGNIARLCIGTNCRLHLVEPLGFDIDEKAARRAGLDYWPHVKLQTHSTWKPEDCPGRCILFTKTAARSIFDFVFQPEDWLVFGTESRGLPKDMIENHPEKCLSLPQYGPVRSQNLSNAAAAAIYLALRELRDAGRKIVEAK